MTKSNLTFDFGTAIEYLEKKKIVRRQSWGEFDYLINTTNNKGDKIFVKIKDGGEKDTYYTSDEYKGSTEDFVASDWEQAKDSSIQKFVVGYTASEFYIDTQNSTHLQYVEKEMDVWWESITYDNIKTAFTSYLPTKYRHDKETDGEE